MTRTAWVLATIWLLAACSFDVPSTAMSPTASIAASEGTIVPTPRPPTATIPPTPTLTPTVEPTATPEPTATDIPDEPLTQTPAPTTNPVLADMGYCDTAFGPPDGARFRARLVSIEGERDDTIDRLTLSFDDTEGSLHGLAACITGDRWGTLAGPNGQPLPGDTVLALGLDDWAHDDAWQASPVQTPIEITGADSFRSVSFIADPRRSRGTIVGIGLRRTLAFRVSVEEAPARIVVEVDRTPRVEDLSDPLNEAAGRVDLPDAPLFFIQNYDVWRFAAGRARPVTTTTELETALAVSPDGMMLAVCRAPANAEPAALPYGVRASLWLMDADGDDQRLLADVGGCADVRFAPSGRTVSFTANDAAGPPDQLSVWTASVVVGDPQPVTPSGDEWNRSDAQWLPDSRLLYRGTDDDGQSVLFIKDDDGSERELTMQLLTGARYVGVGEVVVGDDLIAVEALRAGDTGADLVLLRFDGTEVAVERRGFWQRPLVFRNGTLFYLLTACPSEVVQQYTLISRAPDGTLEELVRGRTQAGIGEVAVLGEQLIITRSVAPLAGAKGPQAQPSDTSRTSLWELANDGAIRREVYQSPVPIRELSVPAAFEP